AERTPAICDLERAGANVVLRAVDVTDAGQVAELFSPSGALAHLPPLRGVVHAAGVLADAGSAVAASTMERAKALMSAGGLFFSTG
ncbi:MAG: KR domain-containing protein, partial [Candidatus Omnitrophica bacterium]|nr:KR domain-containing protein [Candidatus Omnitrophota bacterium]